MTTALAPMMTLCLLANPYLDEARAELRAMRYERAEERLRLAKKVTTSTQAERRELFDMLARAVFAQGRFGEVEELYAELLAADAHAPEPERAAPTLRSSYRAAKERLYPRGTVGLRRLAAPAGRLRLALVDPWSAVTEVVVFESVDEGPFVEKNAVLGGHEATSSLEKLGPGQGLRLYVLARDSEGRALAKLGSAEAPLSAQMPLEPRLEVAADASSLTAPPTRSRWRPLALAVGALVAGGAGAALAVSSARDSQAAQAAHYASDMRALDERARDKAVAANILVGGAVLSAAAAGVFLWAEQ